MGKQKQPTAEEVMSVIKKFLNQSLPAYCHSKINKLTLKCKVNDILDSLDYIELIIHLEAHYNIVITDEECEKHKTFSNLIDSVIVMPLHTPKRK